MPYQQWYGAVKPDPHGSCNLRGKATEPRIFIRIGGTGFAPAGFIKPEVHYIGRRTAFFGDFLQDIRGSIGRAPAVHRSG